MRKRVLIWLIICIMIVASSCTNDATENSLEDIDNSQQLIGSVQMSGSTSMETVAGALAEDFTQKNPGVAVDVQLGGSSVGVKDVEQGKSDIGNVSRELTGKEQTVREFVMAIDGIAIVTHPKNIVDDISREDLRNIYKGEIYNWEQVGGEDMPIVVIGREAASGTRKAFEELLDIEEQCRYAQELNETGAVKTAVSITPEAIGYVSLEALDDTVKLPKINGVPMTEDHIKDGKYILSRPFVMVTQKDPLREEVQAFLDYVLSDEGQAVVGDNNLIKIN